MLSKVGPVRVPELQQRKSTDISDYLTWHQHRSTVSPKEVQAYREQ